MPERMRFTGWQVLARRVRDGLAAAAVCLEDAAEAASAAATAAAERLVSGAAAGGTEGGAGVEVTPELALAMLRRAGRTGSAAAARAFRVRWRCSGDGIRK